MCDTCMHMCMHITIHARAGSVGGREMSDCIAWIFQRKERPVVPMLSNCGAFSPVAKALEKVNDNVRSVLCPGDCKSAK